ncbi:hypothetical protein AB0N23_07855 [Streptomyces sp. NPDC052644]
MRVTELHPDLTSLPGRLRPLVGAALSKDPALQPASDQLAFALSRVVTDSRPRRRRPGCWRGALVPRRRRTSRGGRVPPRRSGARSPSGCSWSYPAAQGAARELLRLVAPDEAVDGSQDTVRSAGYEQLFGGRDAHEAAAAR